MVRLGRSGIWRAGLWRSLAGTIKLAGLFAYAALQLILKRPATREQRAEWLHQFCARSMCRMGVVVREHGPYPERGVVISNHQGYLDIVVFAALHRCVFVSKAEVRGWPILGWMTTVAGTVYVERGRGDSAIRAGSAMHAAIGAGLPVVFFPEGATSDGSTVLKFHRGLLVQAMASGEPVTAAHVRYRLTGNNGPEATVANTVCWWGDTPMVRHIFRLLALRGIEVEVRFAEKPIVFSESFGRRRLAAVEARAAVMELRCAAEAIAP